MLPLKEKLGRCGASRKISFAAALVGVVALIGYIIYGLTFDYFDSVVCLFLAAGTVLSALHFWLEAKAADVCNLLGVMCFSGGIALFFLNSFPVWADELNGITMYASRGGLPPVIAILVLLLVYAIAEIVSCFIPTKKEGK